MSQRPAIFMFNNYNKRYAIFRHLNHIFDVIGDIDLNAMSFVEVKELLLQKELLGNIDHDRGTAQVLCYYRGNILEED